MLFSRNAPPAFMESEVRTSAGLESSAGCMLFQIAAVFSRNLPQKPEALLQLRKKEVSLTR